MPDRDLTVYRTTAANAIIAWHTAATARDTWAKDMQEFLEEHGLGDRSVYISHGGRPLGVTNDDGQDVPEGWRVDSRTGYLMPRLKTKAGKQIDARLAELWQPDPRDSMPGMPRECWISMALLTCGLQIIDNVLYATWSRPIPEEHVNLTIWERMKLSEYYRVLEATGDDGA
ncbi:hypothetical protein [Nonomuraea angiospora]|uniref:hypothetical protein n=1 Tax=Nonomuraea angiospora TaxID=46172 RepID=UPI0029AE9215|nr:hypothetical protein [Nonomuraea angiospora]MDX3111546.1 hypothetical protein [Nonomuraea angiospora]